MIEVRNLSKKYEGKYALKDINFKIEKGEKVAIIGLSGSGKTTLANLLSGVLKTKDNSIFINNIDKNKISSKIYSKYVSIVFQEYQSSFNLKMSIKEILEEPYIIHNLKVDEEKIKEILKITKLDKLNLKDNVKYLSGGEKQRLNIARMILLNPEVLIFDEAISSLDVDLQLQIINILNQINKEYNTTIIFITHNINMIKFLTDKLIVLHEGKIIDKGNINTDMKNNHTKKLLHIW